MSMSTATPTICRLVHYVSYGTPGGEFSKQCRASVITEVTSAEDSEGHKAQYVTVVVLNPKGVFFQDNLLQEDTMKSTDEATGDVSDTGEYRGGTWHWPQDCVHGA